MRLSPYLRAICAIALLSLSAHAARQGTVARIAIISKEPFQLQIQTNTTEQAQAQIVTSPERLVVDIPNALPGPELHGIPIKYGDVRGVRVSLFSADPPITRIVVDLNQPEWYRVAPNSSGVLISLGSDSQNANGGQSTIGWVSSKTEVTVRQASAQAAPFELRKAVVTTKTPARKGPSIEFADGLMTIHSGGATLSEILYQIQKVTGAEIAIPSGTEQDRVGADFGPGTPSEVLGELLNGSNLNFVVVGSESNPNLLRSVILSRKSEDGPAPPTFSQNAAPEAAESAEPEYQEAVPPPVAEQTAQPEQPLPPDQNAPTDQQQNPAAGPPPDPPPS